MELRDKVVAITGSSTGLGWALARSFAAEGAKVVLNSFERDSLPELAETINAKYFVADVTNEQSLHDMAEYAVKEFGRLDIWVNNAGIWLPYSPFEEVQVQRLEQLMAVNFYGTWHGCKAAASVFRQQGTGCLLNILSIRPLEPRAGSSAYSASKAAAIALTKTLRLELKDAGISVCGVYPSGMKTNLFDEEKPDDMETYMEPADVAGLIVDNLMTEHPQEDLVIKSPND